MSLQSLLQPTKQAWPQPSRHAQDVYEPFFLPLSATACILTGLDWLGLVIFRQSLGNLCHGKMPCRTLRTSLAVWVISGQFAHCLSAFSQSDVREHLHDC